MPTAPTNPDVADFLDDSAWTPTVTANATGKLNAWCAWLGDTDPLAANHRHLRRYLTERRDAGIAPATRKKDWQIIRAFYRWAARPTRDGGGALLDDDPMTPVDAPHVSLRPATRSARREEVEAMVAVFERQARATRKRGDGGETARAWRGATMVLLMFTAGCRSGELPGMDFADIVVRRNGRPAIKLRADDTKSGEPRLVPITTETERYLKRYLRHRGEHAGPLFEARYGRRLTARAVQEVVERAAKVAGVPVTAHQLRRGWTSEYFRQGGDVLSLEVVGGWADHRQPRRYFADQEVDAALDRFDDVTSGRLRAVR